MMVEVIAVVLRTATVTTVQVTKKTHGLLVAPPLPSSLRVMQVERRVLHLLLLNWKGFTPKAHLASLLARA